LLYKSNCILGEGPMWHSARKSFMWVDIEGKSIFEYNWQNKKANKWNVGHRVSLIIEDNNDTVVLALQYGLAEFNLETGELYWLTDLEKEIDSNRTNDGACDVQGRLWIGTMDVGCKQGKGSLYCIDKDLLPQKKLENLSISNGITWSLNNERMYHVDTATGIVSAYLFDASTGDIKFEKEAIRVPSELGAPDGMCIDEKGMLWIAHWDGFGVYRWNPHNGILLDKIELPVPQVTACTFGGEDLDHLFITTARENLSHQQLEKYPESGNVFIAKPGVKGFIRNKFYRNGQK
jgi:sugar lactone lactonase YvrE